MAHHHLRIRRIALSARLDSGVAVKAMAAIVHVDQPAGHVPTVAFRIAAKAAHATPATAVVRITDAAQVISPIAAHQPENRICGPSAVLHEARNGVCHSVASCALQLGHSCGFQHMKQVTRIAPAACGVASCNAADGSQMRL